MFVFGGETSVGREAAGVSGGGRPYLEAAGLLERSSSLSPFQPGQTHPLNTRKTPPPANKMQGLWGLSS